MSEKVPAGYAEILDTLNDALDIAEAIDEALKDGFQVLSDLPTFLVIFPKAAEIYADRLRFKQEFLDLDDEETRAIYADLSKARGANLKWVESKALQAIDFVADAYEFVNKGKDLYFKGRALFTGKAA